MDPLVDFEINLTEEEIETLLSDTTKDAMSALTVYGKYVRFCFDGVYANKLERIKALKQSLRNVGLVEGPLKEGFFYKWKMNRFEEEALLRGLNARLFFYFLELYRMQSEVSSELTIKDWKPRKMIVEDHDEVLTQSRFVLFDNRFTIRTSKRVKQALSETIKHSTETSSTAVGLPQLPCSVLANKARYRVACILLDYCGQLEDFCLCHFNGTKKRKRSPSLDILENAYEKVRVKAVVSRASVRVEAPAESTESEPDDNPEVEAPIVETESEPNDAPEVDLEEAPEMQRRNASVTLDVPEGMYRGRKIRKEYKEAWEARNLPVQIKWKTLALLFFILVVVTYGGASVSLDIPYEALIGITVGFIFLFVFLSTHFTRFGVLCAALILYFMWVGGSDSKLSQLGHKDTVVCDWVLHRYHWLVYILCVIASRISKWLSFVVFVGAIVLAATFFNWTFVARFALFVPLWKCYREEVSNPFTMIVVAHRDLFVFIFSIIACVRCVEM